MPLQAFLDDDAGQGLSEYGVMLAILVGLVLLVMGPFRTAMTGLFGRVDASLNRADVGSL